MEKENKLCIIKYSDSNYINLIQNAVQFGLPCLLENVGENLDPGLSPILLKQTFRHGGVDCIQIGDNIIEYNSDFRLYIATESRNPQFPPEIAVKVTLLNFMITPEGLQDQLLGILAAEEKPELEEKKNKLIVEGANNKKQLKEIEDKILKVLSSSQGNILEDETAIQILSSSKILSEEIAAKQKVATATEDEIDRTRDGYRPVADHAAVLFFCIVELENIDPMYKFSLPWFIKIYHHSIIESERKQKIEDRIDDLKTRFTDTMYTRISRSLFHEHVLIFSFILCVGILAGEGKVVPEVWSFLLTGGRPMANEGVIPNPHPTWLADKAWLLLVRLSQIFQFQGLMTHLRDEGPAWERWVASSDPGKTPAPQPWHQLQGLEKITLLSCLRQDSVSLQVRNFIEDRLGQAFMQIPLFNLKASFEDSSSDKPLIFILSPGADPLREISKLAATMLVTERVTTLSLGQGQGPVAEQMIKAAVTSGGWVVLQNCHLATHWLPSLTGVWEEVIAKPETHPEFRLWLTSYPCAAFPTSLLQAGVKVTIQRPQGVKPCLLSFYKSDYVTEGSMYSEAGPTFHRLLFGLAFFHGVVEERRQYGPVGWNIPYEFSPSDLTVSARQLHQLLADSASPPWPALHYLTAQCNYGGRVTDDQDRRLTASLLARSYNNQLVENPGLALSPSGTYCLPLQLEVEAVQEAVQSLPNLVEPGALGLHENAALVRQERESSQLLAGVLATQPQVDAVESVAETAGGVEKEVEKLLALVPPLLPEDLEEKFPTSYEQSLNTVLQLEVARYNSLLRLVGTCLADLAGALRGDIIMSLEIEETLSSVKQGALPLNWLLKVRLLSFSCGSKISTC